MRLKATELCHSIAAWFRDRGHHVLLLVDSDLATPWLAEIALFTRRTARHQRLSAIGIGMIPKLVESAGNSERRIDDRHLTPCWRKATTSKIQ